MIYKVIDSNFHSAILAAPGHNPSSTFAIRMVLIKRIRVLYGQNPTRVSPSPNPGDNGILRSAQYIHIIYQSQKRGALGYDPQTNVSVGCGTIKYPVEF
jgi:hypothetical protein